MSVREVGNGWQADFYAYKERIRKVFPTKREAKDYEGKIKSAIRENRYFDVQPEAFQTFNELSEWYLTLEEVKRKKSFNRDQRSVDKLKDFFGTKPLRQITLSLIGDYQSKRLSEKSYRGNQTMPATINREISCMKTAFNKAIRDRKLSKNPVYGVKMLIENNERERVLSSEEWENYRSHCPDWYLPIAVCAYRTGMRKSEIINLSPARVDLQSGFIRLRPEDTKTGHGRSIPIHPELKEVLRSALRVRLLRTDRIFQKNGKPVDAHAIRLAHESVCEDAGILEFVFHDFRHTCLNNWRKDGHDYFRIMAASGHKTISVFKRYNLVDEQELKSLVSFEDHSQNMVKISGNLPQPPAAKSSKSLIKTGAWDRNRTGTALSTEGF